MVHFKPNLNIHRNIHERLDNDGNAGRVEQNTIIRLKDVECEIYLRISV